MIHRGIVSMGAMNAIALTIFEKHCIKTIENLSIFIHGSKGVKYWQICINLHPLPQSQISNDGPESPCYATLHGPLQGVLMILQQFHLFKIEFLEFVVVSYSSIGFVSVL